MAILESVGNVPGWLIAAFVALFGLAFGSFLNVCIARLPGHASLMRPGSQCPRCHAAIRPRDNVPVASWILLRGKCRDCGWRIPWRYPTVEAATAALFLLCFLEFGWTIEALGMAVLSFLLLGLAVMDAETLRLPNAFTAPGILLGIAYAGAAAWLSPLPRHPSPLYAMIASALSAVAAGFVILLVRWIYFLVRRQEGMGLGDAKLLAMVAAWLGPALALLTLTLGVTAAAVIGLIWILVSGGRRNALTARLPFGSFLCAAALYAIFAGEPIVRWYLGFYR